VADIIVLKIELEVTALSVSKKLQGNHTGKIFFLQQNCNVILNSLPSEATSVNSFKADKTLTGLASTA